MTENNIETVAASDDRVILFIDLGKVDTTGDRINAAAKIGHFLGMQGITDFEKIDSPYTWLALRLSANDAMIVKLRFPIVPDSEIAEHEENQKLLNTSYNAYLHNNLGKAAQAMQQLQAMNNAVSWTPGQWTPQPVPPPAPPSRWTTIRQGIGLIRALLSDEKGSKR